MGIFSKFENKMEDTFEGAADIMSNAPITPVQISKKAEKQMRREAMVGAGKQYAPTLYTVLVNPGDDERMFSFYPTLAGEVETYLSGKADEAGLVMDGHPLVRFVVDEGLRHGKFEVIAEVVAAPIVAQLRQEEMERYGLVARPESQYSYQQPQANDAWGGYGASYAPEQQPEPEPQQPRRKPPLPYVPEEEIDRSIDYGEYTFNSEDFEDYRVKTSQPVPEVVAPMPEYETEYAPEPYDAYEQPYEPQPQPQPQAYQQPAPQQAYQPQPQPQPQQQAYQPQYQQPQPQPQPQYQQPNTVAYAGAPVAQAQAAPQPVRQPLRARVVDVAYRRAYDLAGSHITIGRDSSNDIIVQDINASRKHAELRLTAQGVWTISDLHSTNGTLVNGTRVAAQPLQSGDTITIGKTNLEFMLL